MEKPLISIVVPVYNSAKTLEYCIEDLKMQTLQDIEVIFINDGSCDASAEIINRAIKNDNRFRLLEQKNQGSAAARAMGIQFATGNYIGFMDADDRISKNMYERLVTLAMSIDADVVVCGYNMVTEDGNIISSYHPNSSIITGHEAPFLFYLNGVATVPTQWNKIIRTKIAQSVGIPYSLKIGEDMAFCTEVSLSVKKAVFTDELLYYYVQHENSIMHTDQKMSDHPNQVDHFLEILSQDTRFDIYGCMWKQVLALRALVSVLYTNYSNGQKKDFFLKQIKKLENWSGFNHWVRSLLIGHCIKPLCKVDAISLKAAICMQITGFFMWLHLDSLAASWLSFCRRRLEK